jgi:hypothetical protein
MSRVKCLVGFGFRFSGPRDFNNIFSQRDASRARKTTPTDQAGRMGLRGREKESDEDNVEKAASPL